MWCNYTNANLNGSQWSVQLTHSCTDPKSGAVCKARLGEKMHLTHISLQQASCDLRRVSKVCCQAVTVLHISGLSPLCGRASEVL